MSFEKVFSGELPYYLHLGDCLEFLKTVADNSIDCLVTSPPYWGLRDYGIEGQLGLEPTYQEYIAKLTAIFNEVKRVLKPDGTCFVNIGDTYSKSHIHHRNGLGSSGLRNFNKGTLLDLKIGKQNIESKCLCQIPNRFAIAMTDNGWILRNEIIWHKPNAMPQSVKDRFTVDFEKVFFFTKSKKYYFQQQLDPYTKPLDRWAGDDLKANNDSQWDKATGQPAYRDRNMRPNPNGKNKRAVWSINTQPLKEAHFAAFPEKLVEPMILAGCPENGVVLDIFAGAGTTGVACMNLNRRFIGCELNYDYFEIAKNRIDQALSEPKQEELLDDSMA